MKLKFVFVALFVLFGCSQSTVKPTDTATTAPAIKLVDNRPDWIKKSDELAIQFSKELADLYPETGSTFGFVEYDPKGVLVDEHIEDRFKDLFSKWIQKMDQEIAKANDIELITDFRVFKNWLEGQLENIIISEQEHELEFFPGTKLVYENLFMLSNPNSPLERKKAAAERFKVYVLGDDKHSPLLQAYQEKFMRELKKYKGKKQFQPFREEVQHYLDESLTYVEGVEKILKQSGADWAADFALFKHQVKSYDTFVKKTVLANSRKDPRVPIGMYQQMLKRRTIDRTPNELITKGLSDYKKVYAEFSEKAKVVAKTNNLTDASPAAVIKFLKSKPVTDPTEVQKLYVEADRKLSDIITQHQLISLPKFPLHIRVAGDAESKANPIPHLNPPPLITSNGLRPEFVVPSSSSGLPFDDFSSKDSAMILTAHEGRPGHDMQFSHMLEKGISIVRGTYAFNSVNIEGWALYAEDLVYPYLTEAEQLFALQTRLWRIARMYLEPQIQLGQIKDEKVVDVFTKELGVSKEMAELELRRYKYFDVGQAPSYYEGYLLVKEMQADAKNRLKEKFNLKCFNDKLLSFGLLPLKITAERIKTENLCN